MSISRNQHSAIQHHGLHLVAKSPCNAQTPHIASGAVYRIVAVGAALFLAMTVC